MISASSYAALLYEKNDPVFSYRWSYLELPVEIFERLRFMAAAAEVDLVWSYCWISSVGSGYEDFIILNDFASVYSAHASTVNNAILCYSFENSISETFVVEGSVKDWNAWKNRMTEKGADVQVLKYKEDKHFFTSSSMTAEVRFFGNYTLITDLEDEPLPYGLMRLYAPTKPPVEEYHGIKLEEGLDARVGYLYLLLEGLPKDSLSIQEALFADRAINSYIPEAIKLYTPFADETHVSHGEAMAIFTQQINTLKIQLERISARNERNELNGMRTHLMFLESKNDSVFL